MIEALKRVFGLTAVLSALGSAISVNAMPYDTPPTWGGDLASRPRLSGNWGGVRDDWAKKGVVLDFEDVLRQAGGAAVGRPHVARAIVHGGGAAGMSEAFDRYIGRGRPAFVEKVLPTFAEVAELVHSVRGLVSVAHLKDRGTRAFLERLKGQGLDAVETRHPSHDPDARARLTDIALALGLLRTGGSDWHGDPEPGESHGTIGSQEVPLEWLDRLDQHRLCEVP